MQSEYKVPIIEGIARITRGINGFKYILKIIKILNIFLTIYLLDHAHVIVSVSWISAIELI